MTFSFLRTRKWKYQKPSRIEQDKTVRRRIKYESELDIGFRETIAKMAWGERLDSCMQCGTCSATCPVSHYMDYTPRRIIDMVRQGFKEEVLNSFTLWVCASCYSCMVECPRGIKITDVMYALKREAIKQGFHPKRFLIPMLANKFYKQVLRHGRQNEGRLILSLYLSANPLLLLRNSKLAFRLWRRGRMKLFEKGIRNKASIRKLLSSIERREEEPVQ